jgi:predicted transcriptional regulator
MSKYKPDFFITIDRAIFKILNSKEIRPAVKLVYFILNDLEHQYTNNKTKKVRDDWFFRSIKDLCKDTNLSNKTVIKALQQLEELGLIETRYKHWIQDDGKMSEMHITEMRVIYIGKEKKEEAECKEYTLPSGNSTLCPECK